MTSIAAGTGGLSINLPRDPWTPEKRRAKKGYDPEMDTPPEGLPQPKK